MFSSYWTLFVPGREERRTHTMNSRGVLSTPRAVRLKVSKKEGKEGARPSALVIREEMHALSAGKRWRPKQRKLANDSGQRDGSLPIMASLGGNVFHKLPHADAFQFKHFLLVSRFCGPCFSHVLPSITTYAGEACKVL